VTAASWSCESVSVGVNVGLSCGAKKADGRSEKALKRALEGGIDIPGISRKCIRSEQGRATEELSEGQA
jgi:hypothetical protein